MSGQHPCGGGLRSISIPGRQMRFYFILTALLLDTVSRLTRSTPSWAGNVESALRCGTWGGSLSLNLTSVFPENRLIDPLNVHMKVSGHSHGHSHGHFPRKILEDGTTAYRAPVDGRNCGTFYSVSPLLGVLAAHNCEDSILY
jgi:hypothetical protein